MTDPAAADWTTEKVLEILRAQAAQGEHPSAQVFLADNVTATEVGDRARDIVTTAAAKTSSPDATINHVRRFAKSFSVSAAPDVIAAIAECRDVKSILPNRIDDVYPKPVGKSPA
ncbi:hypothetical protein [Azospirillum lipoferum]|uniref:Uncharacterized protein n=1 Tax=Azospirillum lipoferum (strain 4B) TaxID=862719 RepID=G7ZDZ5_AZOL4|nr:hypothetical protein [Azospirillum lipoferum]CBS89843.1 protein of unknown function [Azospirillum lipoferum 4B]